MVEDGCMIIEMRTYKTKPGKRAEFAEVFRFRSIPAHDEIGMKILGPFLSIEDPDTFYEGELWKNELENLVMPMIEKYELVLVDDPEGLIRW
jgi:hypothetical protein